MGNAAMPKLAPRESHSAATDGIVALHVPFRCMLRLYTSRMHLISQQHIHTALHGHSAFLNAICNALLFMSCQDSKAELQMGRQVCLGNCPSAGQAFSSLSTS